MTLQLDPWFPAAIATKAVTITPADTTTKKTLFTAGANGAKVTVINWATDDTATETGYLWYNDGTTDFLLGQKLIPITAGFITTVPAFSFFDGVQIPAIAIDRDGQRHILLPPTTILKVSVLATVTAAKTHYIFAQGVNF